MKGAIEEEDQLVKQTANARSSLSFKNPADKVTTAQAKIKAFPDVLDYLVNGVGTGKDITGCAEILKNIIQT